MKSLEDLMSALRAEAPDGVIPDESAPVSGWVDGVMELVHKATEDAKRQVWERFDWGAAGSSTDRDDVAAALRLEARNALEATEHSAQEMYLLALLVGAKLAEERPESLELIRQYVNRESAAAEYNNVFVYDSAMRIAAGQRANDETFRRATNG